MIEVIEDTKNEFKEILNENDIEEMYATRIRCSLKNIVSTLFNN